LVILANNHIKTLIILTILTNFLTYTEGIILRN
jgi:hypothetical protein